MQEPLGPRTLIHFDVGGSSAIEQADGRTPPEMGRTARLDAGAEGACLFGAATRQALE